MLTKFYGKKRGCEDVSLTVNAGEVFGFLGPNGAGKTTTIRLLLDFLHPTSGDAQVLGLDTRRDSVAIRARVGYLPGELALYEDLTGDEVVRYFARLRGGVDRAYVRTLAGRLDCDLSRPIRTLSRGNKQKVGLIQAFMSRPPLLILDEPTSGLDPLVQHTFYDLVREARNEGRTVFLSSHVLNEVERIADRVAIIRDGRLVATESIAALKARAPRHFEITFAEPPPADAFANVHNVRHLTLHGPVLRCIATGSVDALIKAAACYDVRNLVSAEPDLEEVFLGYYATADG